MEKTPRVSITPEIAATSWAQMYRDDKKFRDEFDRAPKEAIGSAMGVEMPSGVEIKTHRNSHSEMHIAVPSEALANRLNPPFTEFSDEEMEDIAGGTGGYATSAGRSGIGYDLDARARMQSGNRWMNSMSFGQRQRIFSMYQNSRAGADD